MNKNNNFNMVIYFDGIPLYVTPEQFDILDSYKQKKEFLEKTIVNFLDLMKQGYFDDMLEKTTKDGVSSKRHYNRGLYEMENIIEKWWSEYFKNIWVK